MSKSKILIVEDEGLTALSIKDLLESWGHENPSIALSSDEALKTIEKSKPDLILMDINLNEDIDGIDVANRLKNNFDVPIIYLTAHSDETMLERVKLTEPYGYIVKPFSDEELKITIDTALYRHEMEKELKNANKLLQIELEKRKNAEKKLKKSEEKYRAIVETTHEGIVLFDEKNRISYVNKQIAKMMGYEVEEMLGLHVSNFLMGEYKVEIENELKKHRKGVKRTFEIPLRKIDGSYIWSLISGNVLFDSKNRYSGTLGMVKDISERKKTEMALEEKEEKFRNIIQQSHDGIGIVNENGTLIEWNSGMEEITGYKREHILGKPIWEIYTEVYSEVKVSQRICNHLKTDVMGLIEDKDQECSNELFEAKIVHVDGSRRVVQVRHFPIKTSKEKLIASIVRDVTEQKEIEEELKRAKEDLEIKVQIRTRELKSSNEALKNKIEERKQAEEALIESRNFLDKIINSIADPVFVKDKQHRWMLLNDAFCQLMGYSREKLLGRSDYDFFPSHEADIFWEKDEEVFKNGVENVNEEELTDSKGNVHTIVTKKTLYTDISGERYLVAVIRDITELKKAEEEKKVEHQKLMDIIEFLPDATFVIDRDSKVIAWNRAIEKMTGMSKEEVLGSGDYNYSIPFYGFRRPILIDLILSPDSEVESLYDHVERDGDTLYADIFIPDAFRTERTFLWGIASPLYDNKGNFVGAIESIRNISERKKMEDMLKESEEKYRELFNNANDMITLAELNDDGEVGHYIEVNDVASQRLGYTREELLKMTPKDLVAPEKLSEMPEPTRKLFENGKVTFEIVHMAKEGRRIPVEINSHLFKLKGKDVILAIVRDITERKKTEESLKKSEDYYKTIFENTGTATLIVEEDTTISLVNTECEKLSGYSKGEIEYKKSWKEFVCSDDIEKLMGYHKLRRIDPDSTPRNYEFKFVDRYGNVKNILTTVAIIPETKKSLVALLDITEKRATVNALRESEAQLKIAMDLATLVHWEYDVDSDLFTFDDHFYKLYGTTTDREGGSKMSSKEYARKFIPPEESHLVAEETVKALETDDPNYFSQLEHTIVRADGEKRFIVVRIGIIKDDQGRTIKTYGTNQDITEIKAAEDEIKEHLKKLDIINRVILTANRSDNLQLLLKDITDLILEFMDFDGGGIYLIDQNDRIAKLEYFTGLPQDFMHAVDNIDISKYPYSEVCIEGNSLFTDEYDMSYPEISKPWNLKSLAAFPIYSKEKIIGSFNLTSKHKHYFTDKEKDLMNSIGREIGNTISKLITEEKMKKLITELKRSNDELQQFAYITSHDLQEPLRTIASFTQLLERRYRNKLDEDADEFIDYIVKASIRMKQMILDLLEYSRVARLEKKCEPLNVEDVLVNVLDNLNLLIKENNAEITYESLPAIMADSGQLFRVFQNLIENAIKFKKEDENPKIHISAYIDKENNEYVFSVADNGIGIEDQYFDRIFTIFQRLHTVEVYGGTGIGLSISKRIIESHGGRMWVESEPGVGSTFYFTILNKS